MDLPQGYQPIKYIIMMRSPKDFPLLIFVREVYLTSLFILSFYGTVRITFFVYNRVKPAVHCYLI